MQSPVRAACLQFQARLLRQYTSSAARIEAHVSEEEVAGWIQVCSSYKDNHG